MSLIGRLAEDRSINTDDRVSTDDEQTIRVVQRRGRGRYCERGDCQGLEACRFDDVFRRASISRCRLFSRTHELNKVELQLVEQGNPSG